MRLFIAEKPSVAKAIAAELGITGKSDGFISCGGDTITWCFGHMLEQAEPDEYLPDDVPVNPATGKKLWRAEDLPVIPTTWIMKPRADAEQQLAVIGKMLREASQVVNAGDPDREGQLLVDEILVHFGNKIPVLRYWASAQDSVSVKRALAALKDNRGYRGWGLAAQARSRADWLIGMNLSRAYTLRAQRGGSRALLTVGRVQTPTLALVVARDREIEAFKPIPYYAIHVRVQHANGAFLARWEAKEEQGGLDSEGRLVDGTLADALVLALADKSGRIAQYRQEAKQKGHPRAYSLPDITLAASNKYGYTATEVLEACQSLYEQKLTSYPRTDCGYLPESQHADAPEVMAALKQVNPCLVVDGADTTIKSKTWDDSKVTAHHGIVPTTHKGSAAGLSDQEKNIYDLIVRAYLAQFYPAHEYLSTTAAVDIGGETLRAAGRIVTLPGWRSVYDLDDDEKNEDGERDETDRQSLPAMKQDDEVTSLEATRKDLKTKPPARFTEGTLQRAMENVHKFVTEPEHRKMLRDGDGIGTSATRASIISELKRHEFLETKGKQIVSTALGRNLVDALPGIVKSPVLTALYERVLREIEQNASGFDEFIARQEQFIREQVTKAGIGSVSIPGGKETIKVSERHKCLSCGSGLSRRASTKKKGTYWWGCSNYPACQQTYPDFKGRPEYGKGNHTG